MLITCQKISYEFIFEKSGGIQIFKKYKVGNSEIYEEEITEKTYNGIKIVRNSPQETSDVFQPKFYNIADTIQDLVNNFWWHTRF